MCLSECIIFTALAHLSQKTSSEVDYRCFLRKTNKPKLLSEDICLEIITNLIAADIQFTWPCSFWSRLIQRECCRQWQGKSELAMLVPQGIRGESLPEAKSLTATELSGRWSRVRTLWRRDTFPCLALTRAEEEGIQRKMCRTIFHHSRKKQEDETQRTVWIFTAFNFT